MNTESKQLLVCDVCGQTFVTAGRLKRHKYTTTIHDVVRRTAQNEIVFACNVCNKDYTSAKALSNHRRYAHGVSELPERSNELSVMDTNEEKVEEHPCPADDAPIRNEISHQTERVIELSTSLAMGNVQEAVKRALRSVREEMIPLYAAASVERADAWERVCNILAPIEDDMIMTMLRDTFDLANKLKSDFEYL